MTDQPPLTASHRKGKAPAPRHLALMITDFGDGGVERTLTNLAAGLASLGARVDLLVGQPRHAYLGDRPGQGTIIAMGEPHPGRLERYLADARPDLLMTGKRRDDALALAARDRLGVPTRLVTTVGTPLSALLNERGWNPIKRYRDARDLRGLYSRFDGVTAVSTSVAADLRQHFGVADRALRVLPNPILPADLETLAGTPDPHPWLTPGEPPLIIAVGGLRKVKDFETLIRAFARIAPRTNARLLILGEGRQRARLTALIARRRIGTRIDLPGFVANPFPYIARARLLVVSSRREGLANVLVEAMALGTPVVATDCPGGIRDLLAHGELGPLVPVGDERALAAAMLDTLAAPGAPERLRQAADPYRILPASRAYLGFFEDILAPR